MPATPPSYVRLAAKVRSSITGAATSRPTSDHVPALTYAEPGRRNGIAATAEPVSWVATATTAASPRPVSADASAASGPSLVPGETTSGISRAGIANRSSRSTSQAPALGSKHCVVVAFVSSEVRAPLSQ